VSAVLAFTHKEIWQGSVGAFNARLPHRWRNDLMGLPDEASALC
jgi:hypothetical protein